MNFDLILSRGAQANPYKARLSLLAAMGGVAIVAMLVACLIPAATAFASSDSETIEEIGQTTELVLDVEAAVSLDGEDITEQWFSFTPEIDGVYRFFSSENDGDPYGSLYEKSDDGYTKFDSDDDSVDDINFEISVLLTAGKTYYLKACSYMSGGSASYRVKVELIETDIDFYDLSEWDVNTDEFYGDGSTPITLLDLNPVLELYISDIGYVHASSSVYKFVGWFACDDETGDYVSVSEDPKEGPSEFGAYYALLEGTNGYTGTTYVWFEIYNKLDISTWYSSCDDFYEDGSTPVTYEGLNVRVYMYNDADERIYLGSKNYKFAGWFACDDETGDYVSVSVDPEEGPSEFGAYYALLEGTNGYTGTTYVWFEIYNKFDISNCSKYSYANFYGDGSTSVAYEDLNVRLYMHDSSGDYIELDGDSYKFAGWFVEDDETGDYVLFSDDPNVGPSEPGEYYVTLNGVNGYTGTKYVWFDIYNKLNISNWYYDYDNFYGDGSTPVTYEDLNIRLYMYDSSGDYIELGGDNYKFAGWFAFDNDECLGNEAQMGPSEFGEYYMALNGVNDYTGTAYVYFSVLDTRNIWSWDYDHDKCYGDGSTPVTYENLNVRLYICDNTDEPTYLDASYYKFAGWYSDEEEYLGNDSQKGPSEFGDYYVLLEGTNGYTGTMRVWFYIYDMYDISTWNCGKGRFIYGNGSSSVTYEDLNIELYIYDFYLDEDDWTYLDNNNYEFAGWYTYDDGADKYVSIGADPLAGPAEPGYYQVKISGVSSNGYYGEMYIWFELILKEDSSNTGDSDNPTTPANPDTDSGTSDGSSSGTNGSTTDNSSGSNSSSNSSPSASTGTASGTATAAASTALKTGMKATVSKSTYKVTSAKSKTAAFTGSKATKVSVPATVKIKGKSCKVTSIASKALKGSKATKVVVGSNVKTIGTQAFANSKKLKSLTIGKNVKTVKSSVLKGCKKLKTITIASGKLTKQSIKNLVKGSSVKTIKLKGSAAKKMKAKYQKWLGKKYKVK